MPCRTIPTWPTSLGEHVANQCVTDEALEGMSAFLDKRKPKWAT